MTDDGWTQEKRIQDDYLRDQIAALRRGPRDRWRRFRLLEYVCRGCGETVLEVMDLDPYKTVLYRKTEDHPNPVMPRPAGGSAEELLKYRRDVGTPVRVGDWRFHPLPTPLPLVPDDRRGLSPACRCQDRMLTEALVIADLLAGTRRRTFSATRRD